MSSIVLDENHVIKDEDALRALYPPTHAIAAIKALPALDIHARNFIALSPFLCIGTQNADGKADVSPRGDPPGFVRVLDDETIAIPDRPGNNRLDTMANIVASPQVGILFVVPGFDERLRLNGRATLTRDPNLLARMQVRDRTPTLAIVVQISEVFMHCAKAFRRSRLWDPEHLQNRSDMPTLMKILLDQTTGAPADEAKMAELDEGLEQGYIRSMY